MCVRLRWFAVSAVLCLLASAGSQASTVLQLNLGQLVARAEHIYRGTVLSVSERTVAVGGGQLPVVVYRLRVDESFRGEFTEVKGLRIAEIQTLGKAPMVRRGSVRSAIVLPRMPELEVGRSYLVMLTRRSSIGLSTTVGLGQGCFRISELGKAPMVRRGSVRSAIVLPRMPELEVGRSYLVMMTRPSSIGLSTTVGLVQGSLRISDHGKDEHVANEANNSGLFGGMTPSARVGARSAAAPGTAAAGGAGPIRYAELATNSRALLAR